MHESGIGPKQPCRRPPKAASELGEYNLNGSIIHRFMLTVVGIIVVSISVASAQIVALGHSAVRGHVAENEMWPAVLESMLRARGSQVRVINAGVNGETTGELLARVDGAVPADVEAALAGMRPALDAEGIDQHLL